MECIFADVMNKALICIGTNEDREQNLALCHELLNNAFTGMIYSDTSITAPYGTVYKNDFLNQLALIYTDKAKDEVAGILKLLEKSIGRSPLDKKNGIVKIDIDLVVWNGETLKPDDLGRSYIAGLLPGLHEKSP
jgi:2-amino-4-hydroxy-6-hydroxymethyldihydropteridine diphosphokinase